MAIAPLEKMSLMTSRRLLVEVGNWNAVAVEASSAATAAIWLLKSIIMSVVCCAWSVEKFEVASVKMREVKVTMTEEVSHANIFLL